MRRYEQADAALHAGGGYSAEAEAPADRVQPRASRTGSSASRCGTLSGGQRRRVELARILFSGAETLLLDEPTNHLDADSIVWLRDFLKAHKGGLIVISHDVGLLEACVNKVLHLDANRAEIDLYNIGWKTYLTQRETDEQRRKRERMNAEKKAKALIAQADKMRAKATKAEAAQKMLRRAEKLLAGRRGRASCRQGRQDQVPRPRAVRPDAAHRRGAVQVVRLPGGLHRRRPGDRQGQPGGDPRAERCGQDDAAAHPRRHRPTRHRRGQARGTACKLGYYAQEHETLDTSAAPCWRTCGTPRPSSPTPRPAGCSGSFLFSGDDATSRPAVLSGGEKTRLALATLVVSGANVLLLDEPTNNLDPASREEVLDAIRTYQGAIVLVTHDEGAVTALEPDRVLLLPDGVEDLWNAEYADLVALA